MNKIWKRKLHIYLSVLLLGVLWMSITALAVGQDNSPVDISTYHVRMLGNMTETENGGFTCVYTGEAIMPEFQLYLSDNSYEDVLDVDTDIRYHVEPVTGSAPYYSRSVIDAGQYVIIVEPVAQPITDIKYIGELRIPLTVTPYDMEGALVTAEELSNEDYTGAAITPDVTVRFNNYELSDSENYTVTYQNNIDAGQAYALIEGVKDVYGNYSGNFKGVKKIPFAIIKTMKDMKYSVAASEEYKGGSVTPQLTVTDTLADGSKKVLTAGVDYTLQYENNSAIGVGKIIVTGQGYYKNYHLVKFGILPKNVTGVKVKSPFSMEATVTWKKVTGADGFYVYRKSGSGSFQFIANITDGNYQVFHDKDKSLKSGSKYTYKIVPYVMDKNSSEAVDGKTYSSKSASKKDTNSSYYDYYNYYSTDDYKNTRSYYYKLDTTYYSWYDYSCIKGKCNNAFEGKGAEASGKVTKSASKKRYIIYTGDASIDYMVYLIDKKLIKSGMSDDKRVRVIYDWMVKNCTFTKDVKDYSKLKNMKCYFDFEKKSNQKKADAYEKKVMAKIYKGEALCIGTSWHDAYRASTALAYRKGSCSYLTPMFNVLCNGAGVEAYIVDGDYINADKSRMYHNWSFVKVSGKYYWYDVPVACKNKSNKAYWYKKGTKFSKTYHSMSKNATKGFDSKMFAK